jgi:8-oxo-dGTP pyrophosphatase MutT (NUDIX family)
MDLWQISSIEQTTRSRHEYIKTAKRFESLRRSSMFKLLDGSVVSEWVQPEWGFPKGKRNLNEQPIECAVREMQEETGIHANAYKLCDQECMNSTHAIELFQGTDGRKYKHIYYFAQLTAPDLYVNNPTIDSTNLLQVREISDIKWCTYEECLKRIRSYNIAKLQLIEKVHLSIYAYLQKSVQE